MKGLGKSWSKHHFLVRLEIAGEDQLEKDTQTDLDLGLMETLLTTQGVKDKTIHLSFGFTASRRKAKDVDQ